MFNAKEGLLYSGCSHIRMFVMLTIFGLGVSNWWHENRQTSKMCTVDGTACTLSRILFKLMLH